ncbi:patatin-like protein 3 [Musa acuminata AAA Group]|uniref:patatin-like protein 3 n=1 Tax=Musa acuminata AAA Group TaxID=214697 RepID=UPI0031CFC9B7
MAFVDADKLSYEIFSVLESKFLFGLDDPNKLFFPTSSYSSAGASPRTAAGARGRIRILSIDGGGSPSDALLAAVALARLESSLRHRSGDPSARVAYMFDVAAGSGGGGVLVAMLFTRDHDGRPLFSATDALHLLLSESRRRGRGFSSGRGLFRGMFRRPGRFFRRIFGDATLRDTVKPVLIPCYDLATGAPFLFSRADAVEADGYDFRMWEVCAATCADASTAAVDLRSVDGRTRVTAVGAGVAMANPVAAAITHVLHNKPEFPFAAGVEDLMVVSLGASAPAPAAPGAAELVRIAGEGFADMVDQAVATAFGHRRASNYLRIQLDPAVRKAFDVAYANIYAFHDAQRVPEKDIENMTGVRCKRIARCIGAVGLYVPGGTAVLPSTALMLSVPAHIAGCKTIVLATPPSRDGSICKEVLYCAKKAGVTHILKAGGAQAVSAMAWGTPSCPKVEKNFGPGNQYVTAAKMILQVAFACTMTTLSRDTPRRSGPN